MEIKECMGHVRDSLKEELNGMQKLTGDKREKFNDTFYLDLEEDENIFYNQFNICVTSSRVFEAITPYLNQASKIASIEIPEYNTYLYLYSYFNDQILINYL